MPYTKNQWVNGTTPAINAPDLLKIEDQMDLNLARLRWHMLDEIYGPHGVVTPGTGALCSVSQSTVPGQSVLVGSGEYRVNGYRMFTNGGTVAMPAAHATLPRWDVVVGGVAILSYVQGTAAVAPSIPDNPDPFTWVSFGLVYRAPNDNVISTGEITSFSKLIPDAMLTDAFAAAYTPNAINHNQHKMVLTGNVTSVAPTNSFVGAKLRLVLQQDGTGGRTLPAAGSWTNFLFADTLTNTGNTANKYWVGEFLYDGAKWVQQGRLNQWVY